MKIGIIADTHNHIPGGVFDIFSDVDLIIQLLKTERKLSVTKNG